jgi:hypothetical protein
MSEHCQARTIKGIPCKNSGSRKVGNDVRYCHIHQNHSSHKIELPPVQKIKIPIAQKIKIPIAQKIKKVDFFQPQTIQKVQAIEPSLPCDVAYTTYSWGGVSKDSHMRKRLWKPCNLYIEALNRRIDISSPINQICQNIQNHLPDVEWEKRQLFWFTKLSNDEQGLITSYVSYGFENMNTSLRNGWSYEAPINAIIAKSEPLPNDVTVYRYTSDAESYTKPDQEVTLKGYLSVSFSASHVVKAAFSGKKYSIMRIFIPKGTRCVFIPSDEYELILPHNTTLMIHSKIKETFYSDPVDGCKEPFFKDSLQSVEKDVYDATVLEKTESDLG